MKALLVGFLALSFSSAFANIPERSLSPSTDVLELEIGTRILVTEDLKGMSFKRETSSGFGRWCYLDNRNFNMEGLIAGTILTLAKVSLGEGKKTESKILSIETNEGAEIYCIGSFIEGLSIGKVESVFKNNIKFIKR